VVFEFLKCLLRLSIEVSRLEVRKHFFSQRAPEEWKEIPPVVKNIENANAFRNAYRKHRLPEAAA
jgi:hypothetical protein